MRNIVIADCGKSEMVPFMKGICSTYGEEFSLEIVKGVEKLNKKRCGMLGDLKRYFHYFSAPIYYVLFRRKFNYIIAWQQFYALIFCFYSNVFKLKKTNTVIACNFTYKEKAKFKKLYYWFMKKCLEGDYLDYLHVPSREYADQISIDFGFDRKKIIVAPYGILDEYEQLKKLSVPKGLKKDEYIVSIGRSNRDYDFLIDAWKNIEYKLVLISDVYKKKTDNPNVIIRNDIGGDEQYSWIVNSKAIIIPIAEEKIASGDTVLLRAMSLKKIVIVTKPSTLAEMYIENGVNGISVEKNKKQFQRVINDLLNGAFANIGGQAREDFLQNYSREALGERIGEGIFLK